MNLSSEIKQETCEIHGNYESINIFGKIWSKCPDCSKEREIKEKAEKEEKDRAEKLAAWKRKIGNSGIPERFQSRTFDNFEAKTKQQIYALDFAKNFIDAARKTGMSALFVGRPGTGKTHLASAIGMEFIKNGEAVLFITAMRAIRKIKDTWSRDSEESESQAVASLVYPELLILDEIGIQFGSEFEKNIIFDVLNERYEKRKPTIIMSNLPKDEVFAYLGDRVLDRLREDGGEYVAFDWESHRGKK